MKTIIVLILMFLIGCAPTVYVKDGSTKEDFERDQYECQQRAYQHAANINAYNNPFIIIFHTKECLEKYKGWRKQ